MGRQIRRVHALTPSGVTPGEDWTALGIAAAAERSSLPPHLVAQVDDYIAGLDPFDSVFTHADLTTRHVFVENGRLTGIIDWGDATVADRHYEIIQPCRDIFDCDKALLRAFLDACDWPVGDDFPRRAMGHALYRQAMGLARHLSMDVFEPIAAMFPLEDIATLDELAAVDTPSSARSSSRPRLLPSSKRQRDPQATDLGYSQGLRGPRRRIGQKNADIWPILLTRP